MKIQRIASAPAVSPYAPSWDYSIGHDVIDDIDLSVLAKTILRKERSIKRLGLSYTAKGDVFDGYTGLGSNSTTSRSNSYNVLTWGTEETNQLKRKILENVVIYNGGLGHPVPKELWVQCWVNVLRFRQHIKPHLHSTEPTCYLSGHFVVQCEKTATVYVSPVNQLNDPYEVVMGNEPGSMTIFPSYIPHYTTPHHSFKPRITLAFDLSLTRSTDNFIRLL